MAAAAGIELRRMQGHGCAHPIRWEDLAPDVLHVLLHHSDCDGSIAWGFTQALAERLEGLLPGIERVAQEMGSPWLVAATERFAQGLRLAYAEGDDVHFD